MNRARKLQYLDAMGITVWQANSTASPAPVAEAHEVVAEQDTLDAALERAIQAPPPELPEVTATLTEPAVTLPVHDLGWSALEDQVKGCRLCRLCESRAQAVFGVGLQTAELMVIGEAPSAAEDTQGQPFVGTEGKLLDAMLAAINYSRTPSAGQKAAYITNLVKCKRPEDQDLQSEEAARCRPYLDRQIALLQPRLILAIGGGAAQGLLASSEKVGELREGLHEYKVSGSDLQIPVLVTYHPEYLIKSPKAKRKAWEDLKRARSLLQQGSKPEEINERPAR